MTKAAPHLLTAKVMHARTLPRRNAFTYSVYYWVLPLSGLTKLEMPCNQRALTAFHTRDHGDRKGGDLEGWAHDILEQAGLAAPHEILLMAMPRVLGYVFNPVSFWFCLDERGDLTAVICEVNNTSR